MYIIIYIILVFVAYLTYRLGHYLDNRYLNIYMTLKYRWTVADRNLAILCSLLLAPLVILFWSFPIVYEVFLFLSNSIYVKFDKFCNLFIDDRESKW